MTPSRMDVQAGLALWAGLVLGGCGGTDAQPFSPVGGDGAAGLFWALTLDQQVATLSTAAGYNTLQLTATPRDAHGNPLAGLGPVTFRSASPNVATVTADGLVSAVAPGQNVQVIAELTTGGIEHAATVAINVTNLSNPPELGQLSIAPPDSTTWAVGGDGTWLVINNQGVGQLGAGLKFYLPTALDVHGNPMDGVAASYRASDQTVLEMIPAASAVAFQGKKPGRVKVYAATTMYGVTMTDTVALTVTMPVFAVVRVRPDPRDRSKLVFVPSDLSVAPGATVIWTNVTGQPLDVVFDDPTGVVEHGAVNCAKAGVVDAGGTGNILAFGVAQDTTGGLNPENCRSRRLPAPGVYTYSSPLTGATGRIVVETGVPAP